jgi:hypothetical protein
MFKCCWYKYPLTLILQLHQRIYLLIISVKESSQRARLEEEMLSAMSDSVVEVALLRAEYERKQEIVHAKLKETHKKDLEKGKVKKEPERFVLLSPKYVYYLKACLHGGG